MACWWGGHPLVALASGAALQIRAEYGCSIPNIHPLQGESTMAEGPLQGKVAIITGAASPIGLGHAITVALVRAGARVALLDINDTWLAHSAAEMRTIGGAGCALPLRVDITDPAAAEQAVRQTIVELGGLHILINNAGISPRAAEFSAVPPSTNFWDISPTVW